MDQKLLVVEDDPGVRTTIVTCLEMEGYQVDAVSSTSEAMERLLEESYPIVITDIYIDDRTGLDVLDAARRKDPNCSVILMTARGTMETVMAATRGGAFDYIAKPFDLDRMVETVRRAEALRGDVEEDAEPEELPESEMIGSSRSMVEIYKTAAQVAPTDATVLIEGETGTGKELVARMIHRFSKRAEMPFVPVDCASIAPTLLESELFGAMKGSYTGAEKDRVGVLESAHRGTVFLDEIGEVEFGFQLKLLRFMQEREVRPLGASRAKPVDVRVVAATNKDVQKLVEDGKFREDLWFRLNVIRLRLPALRDRKGDVPLLAHFFLAKYNGRYNRDTRITESGLKALDEHSWPGNVRQLQHLIERLTILAPNDRIDGEAVRDALALMEPREHTVETLADAETEQIRKVLAATGGNKSRAAQILGIERKTLYRKLERMK
jgi:two-component system, NtrC family, response regulator HydG